METVLFCNPLELNPPNRGPKSEFDPNDNLLIFEGPNGNMIFKKVQCAVSHFYASCGLSQLLGVALDEQLEAWQSSVPLDSSHSCRHIIVWRTIFWTFLAFLDNFEVLSFIILGLHICTVMAMGHDCTNFVKIIRLEDKRRALGPGNLTK